MQFEGSISNIDYIKSKDRYSLRTVRADRTGEGCAISSASLAVRAVIPDLTVRHK